MMPIMDELLVSVFIVDPHKVVSTSSVVLRELRHRD